MLVVFIIHDGINGLLLLIRLSMDFSFNLSIEIIAVAFTSLSSPRAGAAAVVAAVTA